MDDLPTGSAQTLYGLILAGGQATRLTNKPLVMFDKLTMIEHVFNRLRPQVDRVWISGTPTLKNQMPSLGALMVVDQTPYEGPMAGVAQAIAQMPLQSFTDESWVLIVACDCPLLPRDLGRQLIGSAENKPVVLAQDSKQNHQPLFGIWKKSTLKQLLSSYAQGERSLLRFAIAQGAGFQTIKEKPTDRLLNINDSMGLQALRDEWERYLRESSSPGNEAK